MKDFGLWLRDITAGFLLAAVAIAVVAIINYAVALP